MTYKYEIQRVYGEGNIEVVDVYESSYPTRPEQIFKKLAQWAEQGVAAIGLDDPNQRTWETPSCASFYPEDSDKFEFLGFVRDVH